MEGWFDVTARPLAAGPSSLWKLASTQLAGSGSSTRRGSARPGSAALVREGHARPFGGRQHRRRCHRRAAWYLTKAGAFRLSLRSYGMELGHREPFSRKLPRRSGPELPRRPGTKSPSNDRLRSRRRGKRTQGRLAKWSSQPRSRPGRVPRRSAASRRAQRPATERAGL